MEFQEPQVSDEYVGSKRIVKIAIFEVARSVSIRVAFFDQPKDPSETAAVEDARYIEKAREALLAAVNSLNP